MTVLLALLAGACRSDSTIPPPVSHAVVKRTQMHMGTLVTLTASASTPEVAQKVVAAGFREIRRLEGLWSTWISTSELSRVNAAAGRQPIRVSPETLDLVRRALEIGTLTGGAFNVLVGPAVDAWNISRDPHVPNPEELIRIRPLLDPGDVQLDDRAGTVYLKKPGMRIDVGGIGKGYAADLTVAVMQRAGAESGVVALSGDMRTFGPMPDGSRYRFGIQHPRKAEALLARINLRDEAISTAGDYERYFEIDGVLYHHILDPRTLQPARGCQSVTVIAKEGIMADGLDTGIFVLGPDEGMKLVERLPDVEAIIVDAQGNLSVSSGLRDRVMLDPSDSEDAARRLVQE
jgi:thiamine biosynthesis lipoprotein